MSIITLTTDMGLSDHYVASIKGSLLKGVSDKHSVHLVDVTHFINAFDIVQAAFQLRNCIADFPDGTIHLITVDSEPIINYGSPHLSSLPAILLYKNQYFVSNDNGVLSLIVGENSYDGIWHVEDALSKPSAFIFPAKNILVPIAVKLANGISPDEIGEKVDSFKRMTSLNAVIEPNLIRGNIIHIDYYGNVITNIDKELFNRFGENTPFSITFRKKEYYIDQISVSYGDVVPGERLAFFNSSGLLEIAINRGARTRNGGANTLLGLALNDTIRIDFSPAGSKETLESLF